METLIGKELEDFKVQAYHNGQFKEVTRDSVLGKWSIFFFYPADFTFVCPTELGDMADHYDEFQKLNAEIYSVSADSHFVHKAWADASDTVRKIRYPMLADPVFTLARFFGVLAEEDGQALRGTFIVNPDGIIKAYEVHDMASAATPRSFCASCRPRSSWPSTATRSAQPSGNPARRP